MRLRAQANEKCWTLKIGCSVRLLACEESTTARRNSKLADPYCSVGVPHHSVPCAFSEPGRSRCRLEVGPLRWAAVRYGLVVQCCISNFRSASRSTPFGPGCHELPVLVLLR